MSQPRQSKALGYFYRVFGIVLWLGATFFALAVFPDDGPAKGVFFMGLLVVVFFWNLGSRHIQPLAEEVLSNDARPPILYLRSFINEEQVHTEEAGFADLFAPVGPFVAIGQPGEQLPPLGAARLYVENDNWQAKVLELLTQAKLVVIYGGETPGLGWELRQVRERLHPSRVTIMIPNNKDAWETFRNTAYAFAELHLPPMPSGKMARYATPGVVGFLSFDDGWNPRFTPLPKRSTRATGGGLNVSDTAAQSALALSQIYSKLGIQVDAPRRSGLLIYIKIIRVYAALAFIVVALLFAAFFAMMAAGYIEYDDQELYRWIYKPPWWPF